MVNQGESKFLIGVLFGHRLVPVHAHGLGMLRVVQQIIKGVNQAHGVT